MKAVLLPWTRLKAGYLFKSRDDDYPVKVIYSLPDSVIVRKGLYTWRIYFRPGARVLVFKP